MTIEEKILAEMGAIAPDVYAPELSEQAYRQAVIECQSIITKHLHALSAEDAAREITSAGKKPVDLGGGLVFDSELNQGFAALYARAVLALIRRDV